MSGAFTITSTYATDVTNATVTDNPGNPGASCKIGTADPPTGSNPYTALTIPAGAGFDSVPAVTLYYACDFPAGAANGANTVDVTDAVGGPLATDDDPL